MCSTPPPVPPPPSFVFIDRVLTQSCFISPRDCWCLLDGWDALRRLPLVTAESQFGSFPLVGTVESRIMIHDADVMGSNESRRDWKKVLLLKVVHFIWTVPFLCLRSQKQSKNQGALAPPPHSLALHQNLIHNMDHNP